MNVGNSLLVEYALIEIGRDHGVCQERLCLGRIRTLGTPGP